MRKKGSKNKPLNTAVSFHVFNRPEGTKQVFDQIRKARPSRLFITADAPRNGVQSDVDKCKLVREIVKGVDWKCKVYENFYTQNQGSYHAATKGTNWVFKHVDRAIFIEDDDIPDVSFFYYCQELLGRYEEDNRVGVISGNNFYAEKYLEFDSSYFFSKYPNLWGWATWKKTWDMVDLDLTTWPLVSGDKNLNTVFCKWHERHYWENLFNDMYQGNRRKNWDLILSLHMFINNKLTVVPRVNLVKNIGFDEDATNCNQESILQNIPVEELSLPLTHPPYLVANYKYDKFFSNTANSRGFARYLKKLMLIKMNRMRSKCESR